MTSKNAKTDKVITYKGMIQVTTPDGQNNVEWIFVQSLEYTVDDTDIQRDRIDDGTPVFTRLGDIVGHFKFSVKDTIDMYDATNPAIDQQTMSYWMEQIAQDNFPTLTFIHQKKAPKSSGNQFARPTFVGRITKCTDGRPQGVAVEDASIEGEVISFVSSIRSVS